MDFETLRFEVDNGLARLTLDRPENMNTAEAFRAFVEKRKPDFR